VKFDGWRGKYEKIKMLPDARKLSNVMEGKFSMRKKRGGAGMVTDSSTPTTKRELNELSKRR